MTKLIRNQQHHVQHSRPRRPRLKSTTSATSRTSSFSNSKRHLAYRPCAEGPPSLVEELAATNAT
eukprot:7200942-Karenia_brevis.AAC.1